MALSICVVRTEWAINVSVVRKGIETVDALEINPSLVLQQFIAVSRHEQLVDFGSGSEASYHSAPQHVNIAIPKPYHILLHDTTRDTCCD